MNCRRLSTVGAVLAGLLLSVTDARAQDVAVEDYRPAEAGQKIQGTAGYGHMFKTDVDQNGRVDRNDVTVGVRGHYAFNDSFSIDPLFRYELNAYNFNSADPFRWENINQFILGALLGWKLDDNWSLLGGPVFRYAGESGADSHRAVQGGGLLGFNYRRDENLQLGLMVGAISGIAEKASIVPIPTVDWRFADDWRLHAGLQYLGGRTGLGGEVGWKFADEWELAAGAQFESRRYRLDNNGPAVTRNGVGQETSVPVFGRISFMPTDNGAFEIFAGAALNGQLRVERQSGNRVSTSDYDPAPIAGVRARVVF